jgi:benzodiazapine receptor
VNHDGTLAVWLSERDMTKVTQWIGLVVFLIVCLGAGGLGAIATTPEIEGWYKTITKPSWNPPDSVFGPVWTTLYVLMAIAAWMVWRQDGFKTAGTPLTLFGVQLGLNFAWSLIFFGMHQPGWAFAEIVILWLAIVSTVVTFFRISKVAGWLMVPYLVWVSFASVLNFHDLAIECGLMYSHYLGELSVAI